MSRILGIAGSMKENDSSSEYLLSVALDAAGKASHVETEMVSLRDFSILPCTGCGKCMEGEHCKLLDNPADDFRKLYEKMCKADAFIFAYPVYALSTPSIWRNWIERCEPCSAHDLDFEIYHYDRAQQVKGKALRGKVAGQIAIAAGPGHEWAMTSMLPAFTCSRLSMVASVGMSLIQYDGQPGIQKKHFAKDLKEAQFLIMMAQGVGQRVADALYYTHFDTPTNWVIPIEKLGDIRVELPEGQEKTLEEAYHHAPFLAIATDRNHLKEAQSLIERLRREKGKEAVLIVDVQRIPRMIPIEEIRKGIYTHAGKDVWISWDGQLSASEEIPALPWLLFRDENGSWCKKNFDDSPDSGAGV